MLAHELTTAEFPSIFDRFSNDVGELNWKKRAQSVRQEIKGNPYLADFLRGEYSIVFALDRLSDMKARYGRLRVEALNELSLMPAMSFAAQMMALVDIAPDERKAGIVRRLHGAFKNPDDLHAMQLEFLAATHFMRRGHRVSWPELDGDGVCDLLVHGFGEVPLQVECKSIGSDKGRKIHEREAIEFHRLLKQALDSVIKQIRTSLFVVLTVPGRLPTAFKERQALAKCAARAVLANANATTPDGSTVRIEHFRSDELMRAVQQGDSGRLRTLAETIAGVRNRQMLIIAKEDGPLVVLVLQSLQDDSMLDAMFQTISDSARRQLSPEIPALYVIGLRGISPEEMANVGKEEVDSTPTALRLEVSRFLAGSNRDPIIGICFLSQSALHRRPDGVVTSASKSYTFYRRDTTFWLPSFEGML